MHREITSIFGQNKVILRESKRAVTPYGGLAVFVEYLQKIRLLRDGPGEYACSFDFTERYNPTKPSRLS